MEPETEFEHEEIMTKIHEGFFRSDICISGESINHSCLCFWIHSLYFHFKALLSFDGNWMLRLIKVGDHRDKKTRQKKKKKTGGMKRSPLRWETGAYFLTVFRLVMSCWRKAKSNTEEASRLTKHVLSGKFTASSLFLFSPERRGALI